MLFIFFAAKLLIAFVVATYFTVVSVSFFFATVDVFLLLELVAFAVHQDPTLLYHPWPVNGVGS